VQLGSLTTFWLARADAHDAGPEVGGLPGDIARRIDETARVRHGRVHAARVSGDVSAAKAHRLLEHLKPVAGREVEQHPVKARRKACRLFEVAPPAQSTGPTPAIVSSPPRPRARSFTVGEAAEHHVAIAVNSDHRQVEFGERTARSARTEGLSDVRGYESTVNRRSATST
jgi:hypothetical protein